MNTLQEAEEAAAAEVLKLQAELEMEEAGLQPHFEEDEEEPPDECDNEKGELLAEDNHESNGLVPETQLELNLLSEQQSYQLYVQASKPAAPDGLEDANITLNDGADGDDNNTLYSQEIDIQHSHSRASDDSLRRRRVRDIISIQ